MSDGGSVIKWVAIGCGAFVLLGFCCGGGCFIAYNTATGDPHDAATSFLKDVRDRNYDSAYRRMGASYQGATPASQFQQRVVTLNALANHTDATIYVTELNDEASTVTGTLESGGGDADVQIYLRQAGNDHWYVESVTVQGQSLP